MTMAATKEENAGLWEVICVVPDGKGGTIHAGLTHKGRDEWRKRTAVKHAREYKALHLRDAWAQPVDMES